MRGRGVHDRRRIPVVLLALATITPLALPGCVETGPQRLAWWEPVPADRWQPRPAEANLALEPPSAPSLNRTLTGIENRTTKRIDGLPESDPANRSSDASQALLRAAQDERRGGRLVAAIPLLSRAIGSTMDVEARATVVGDAEAVERRIREIDPDGTRKRTAQTLNSTLRSVNTTGLLDIFGVSPWFQQEWLVVRYNYVQTDWASRIGSSTRSHVEALGDAHLAVGAHQVVTSVLENASRRPGPAVPSARGAELAPLFDAANGTPDRIPRFDAAVEESLPVRDAADGVAEVKRYLRWDRPRLAAHSALAALVYTEVAQRLYNDALPDTSEMATAMRTVSNGTGPLGTVWGQRAWSAYDRASSDPNFMLVPVAIAELWPLIEELDAYLVDGDPVAWDRALDPHLERWRATWTSPSEA